MSASARTGRARIDKPTNRRAGCALKCAPMGATPAMQTSATTHATSVDAHRVRERALVDTYVTRRARRPLNAIADLGSHVLLPLVAVALGVLVVWLAVINTVALHSYIDRPASPWGLAWAAAVSQELFILVGEAALVLNSVLLRRRRFYVGGGLMTAAGNATALWWHLTHAAAQDRPALVMVVLFVAVALTMFVAIVHRAITSAALADGAPDAHSARIPAQARDGDRPVDAVDQEPDDHGAQDERAGGAGCAPSLTIVSVADASQILEVPGSTIRTWVARGHLVNRNPDGEPMRVAIEDVRTVRADRAHPAR